MFGCRINETTLYLCMHVSACLPTHPYSQMHAQTHPQTCRQNRFISLCTDICMIIFFPPVVLSKSTIAISNLAFPFIYLSGFYTLCVQILFCSWLFEDKPVCPRHPSPFPRTCQTASKYLRRQ